jgi:carboxymethylenebutenolidase
LSSFISATASSLTSTSYWDQASVLAQLGLIDVATLPVGGADTARKALDPSLPANALIRRAALV